ncbi:MAG: hypothetical protein RLZZ623_1894 [Actinomycetota bacterium]
MKAGTSRAAAWAPVVFVLLWSTGFVGAKYGTRDTGALTFLAIRFSAATVILGVVACAMKAPRPSRNETRWILVAGALMQAVYLGGVFIAIGLGLPSGLGALITGLHPVITSIAARRVLDERLVRVQWIGVGLGFFGVVAVVVDRLLAHTAGVTGLALLAAAFGVIGISGGTLVQRKKCAHAPLVWSTVLQFASAAVLMLAASAIFEHFDVEFTTATVGALIWAVFVLSIGAVMIMLWLLKHHAAAKVSSLFFLTPALSTIEGAILFDERLGPLALVGLAVSLTGVALVTAR